MEKRLVLCVFVMLLPNSILRGKGGCVDGSSNRNYDVWRPQNMAMGFCLVYRSKEGRADHHPSNKFIWRNMAYRESKEMEE